MPTRCSRVASVALGFAAFGSVLVISAGSMAQPSAPPPAPDPIFASPQGAPPPGATPLEPVTPMPPYAGPEPYGRPAEPHNAPPAWGNQAAPDARTRSLVLRPLRLAWEQGEAIPPGYLPADRADRGLLIAGAVVWGAAGLPSFVAGWVGAVGAGEEGLIPMFVPVIGPLITIGTVDAGGFLSYILTLDALTQATGMTLLITSFVKRDTYLERQDAPQPGLRFGVSPSTARMEVTF